MTKLPGHANVTVTASTHERLDVVDARKATEPAGWLETPQR